MIGNYNHVPSEVVIPLGRKYGGGNLIMPGNLRPPTLDAKLESKDMGNVPVVVLRPKLSREAVTDPYDTDPQPQEINMADFFRGGVYHG